MSPPSVSTLPVELLEEIAEIIPLDEQLVLCQVSKSFHSSTIRSIYRDISLDRPSAVIACCRTLVANPIAASSIRQLSITYTPVAPTKTHYFPAFYSLIAKGLAGLSQIQQLRIMVYDANYIHTIASARFPQLQHLECYLSLTSPLLAFLNNHPALTYLQTGPHEALEPVDPIPQQISPSAPIYPPKSLSLARGNLNLPDLQYFTGNAECISLLSPAGAPLRAAFLFWDAVDGTPQDAIGTLARSSTGTLNVLSCRRRGWNLDLFELISTYLPDIYVLSMTNLLVVDARPSEPYLNTMKFLLPRFTTLRKLHLHCVDTWRMADIKSNLDDDYATVCAWSAACVTLVECILPHSNGLTWIRIPLPMSSSSSSPVQSSTPSYIWLPDPNCPHIHGTEWIWKMLSFASRKNGWDRLTEFIKGRLPGASNLFGARRMRGDSASGRAGGMGMGVGAGSLRHRSASLSFGLHGGTRVNEGYEAVLDVLRELSWGGDDM